eukprot:793748_1
MEWNVSVHNGRNFSIQRNKPFNGGAFFLKQKLQNLWYLVADCSLGEARVAAVNCDGECPRPFFEARYGARFSVFAVSGDGGIVALGLKSGDFVIWPTSSQKLLCVDGPPTGRRRQAETAKQVWFKQSVELGYQDLAVSD